MTRPSDQPNAVEAVAFSMFALDTFPDGAAFDADDGAAVWRTVDALTKERYRERAQQEMRDFEDRPPNPTTTHQRKG